MAKTISDNRKRRGRPKTGIGKPVGLRLYPDLEAALKRWIKAQPAPRPGMPEAIRRLLEQALTENNGEGARTMIDRALTGAAPTKPTSPKSAAKAVDMAGVQLDRMANLALPEVERRARKRWLIRGPREFRTMRGDEPKRKD
jgi:hypothetical protein